MAHLLAEMLDEALVPGPFVGSSGFPLAYSIASSPEDVRARGAAFAATARRSGGFMGRSPDFLATVLTAWRAASPHFGKHADDLVRYRERARTLDLVLTHAISDPPGDRHLPAELRGAPRTLRAVDRTAEGLAVSGAKMLATLAPFADDLVVYPFRPLGPAEADQALCFAVPVATPGSCCTAARRSRSAHRRSGLAHALPAGAVGRGVRTPGTCEAFRRPHRALRAGKAVS